MPPTIRLATLDDAEPVRDIYGAYFDTPITFELEPPSVDEMRGRMEKVLAGHLWLVCEDRGKVVGYVYASSHRERAAYRWAVDTTVYIARDRRRGGVGRALYTSLLAILPLQGYVTACAGVTVPNAGSVGLHQAMGFELVGTYRHVGFKGGVWHDVAWFQRDLLPLPTDPPEPRPLEAVRGSAAWEAALSAGPRFLRA